MRLRFPRLRALGAAVCSLLLIWASLASAAEPKRLLLLAQKPDTHPKTTHEYLPGQQLLARLLQDVKEVEAKVIQADDPWEDGPEQLKQADGAVLFLTEGARWIHAEPRRLEAFTQLAARGGGLSVLHWGMGSREAEPIEPFVKLFGGCHGGPDRKYKVVKDAEVRPAQHAIARGMSGFTVEDEFYYKLKLTKDRGLSPVWQVPIDGATETVAWAWDRPDGGRSFGFSGLHFHANWKKPEYRRLVLQGVLWSLKVEIPKAGLSVELPDEAFELKP